MSSYAQKLARWQRKKRKQKHNRARYSGLEWSPKVAPQPVPEYLLGARAIVKTLRVSTEFFAATAKFEKRYGAWACCSANHPLGWMVGKSMSQIQVALLKMGAQFDWVSAIESGSADSRHSLQCDSQGRGTNSGNGVTNPTESQHAPESGRETVSSVASLSLQTGGSTHSRAQASP